MQDAYWIELKALPKQPMRVGRIKKKKRIPDALATVNKAYRSVNALQTRRKLAANTSRCVYGALP